MQSIKAYREKTISNESFVLEESAFFNCTWCLCSVDIIYVEGKKRQAPQKAYYLLAMKTESPSTAETCRERIVFSQSQAKDNPMALNIIENKFRSELGRVIGDFVDVAGKKRACSVVREELAVFENGKELKYGT